MNVWALAIPLTGLFTCSNLCASATACCPRFVLNTSTDWQPLGICDLGLLLVVLAHGSGFPLTDATSHELGTVGFSDIAAFDEQVKNRDISAIVIHLELAALEPTEQARADIPSAMKREPVS